MQDSAEQRRIVQDSAGRVQEKSSAMQEDNAGRFITEGDNAGRFITEEDNSGRFITEEDNAGR